MHVLGLIFGVRLLYLCMYILQQKDLEQTEKLFDVRVLSSMTAGSLVLTFIISMLTFLLGLKCRSNNVEPKLNFKNISQSHETENYEVIDQTTFHLSDNAAYGEVHNL